MIQSFEQFHNLQELYQKQHLFNNFINTNKKYINLKYKNIDLYKSVKIIITFSIKPANNNIKIINI